MTWTMVWMWLANNTHVWVPILGALLSLAYTKLDSTQRGHALLSFLAGLLPLDLPKMTEALKNLIASFAKKKLEDGSVKSVLLFACAAAFAGSVSGCAWFKAKGPEVETVAIGAAECVMDTLDKHPDWQWWQVAETCAVQETPALVSLFNDEKPRAMARYAARAAACK